MVNNAPSFQYPTSNVPHEAQFTDVSVTDIRAYIEFSVLHYELLTI